MKLSNDSDNSDEEMLEVLNETDDEFRGATVHFKNKQNMDTCEIDTAYGLISGDKPKLNLKPVYQRTFCWSKSQQENLIKTIMDYCPMPIFLFYDYTDDSEDEIRTFECIDGQNRLNTIKQFMEQVRTQDHEFDDAVAWRGYSGGMTTAVGKTKKGGGGAVVDEGDVHYFYPPAKEEDRKNMQMWMDRQNELPRNVDTRIKKQRIRRFQYMTGKQVARFHSYSLAYCKLGEKLPMDARREIFMRLQHGTPTSECDKFKNKKLAFCQFIFECDVERRLFNPNNSSITRLAAMLKTSSGEWLWDTYRLITVFCKTSTGKLQHTNRFILSRKHCIQAIAGSPFDPQWPEALVMCEEFVNCICQWATCRGKMQMSTILVLADQWHVDPTPFQDRYLEMRIANSLKSKDIMHCSLISPLSVTNFTKKFESVKADMFTAPIPLHKEHKKQNIPNQRKTEVWNFHVGKAMGLSPCFCCKKVEISSRDFVAGHILSEAFGGTIDVENLLPICIACNSSMGTMHMEEYKALMKY
jgi:hypothetical protein